MSFDGCYLCGQPGHRRADCPKKRVPVREEPPAGDAAAAAPKWRGNPVPPRRPESEISTRSHEWANHARALLGELPTCGQQADLYASEFRRKEHLAPVHQCVLRQLAAAQVSESRAARAAAAPERKSA